MPDHAVTPHDPEIIDDLQAYFSTLELPHRLTLRYQIEHIDAIEKAENLDKDDTFSICPKTAPAYGELARAYLQWNELQENPLTDEEQLYTKLTPFFNELTAFFEQQNEHFPERYPAYAYLVKNWLNYNQARKLESELTEEDKSAGKVARITDEKKAAAEIKSLFLGLENYFNHANRFQESLIELNAEAAMKSLLADALVMMLDQNETLAQDGDIKTEAVLSAVHEVAKTLFIEYDEVIPQISKKIIDATQRSINKPTLESSHQLRDAVNEWVLNSNFKLPAIKPDEAAITAFRSARQKQTKALDEYQNNLAQTYYQLKKFLPTIDNETQDKSTMKFLRKQISETIIPNIQNRLEEIEAFRNGAIKEISQEGELHDFSLHLSEEQIGELRSDFISMNEKGKAILSLPKIASAYTRIEEPSHPLISMVYYINNRMQIIRGNANNELYQNDMPGIHVKESGIKSWRRTVEKLIHKKGCNWKEMTDLARINMSFDHAESMFFYNQALRHTAQEKGWSTYAQDSTKPLDKGLTMFDTGSISWLMRLSIYDEISGQNWTVETKLDDEAQLKADRTNHILYESARLLEGKERGINFDNLSLEHYNHFRLGAMRNMEKLLSYGDLSPNFHQRVNHIYTDLQNAHEIDQAPKLYSQLNEAHFLSCIEAAKKASPSMATMYHQHFTELMQEKTDRVLVWEKQLSHLEGDDEKKILSELIEQEKEHIKQYNNLYAEYGPSYSEEWEKRLETLEKNFRQSYQQKIRESH